MHVKCDVHAVIFNLLSANTCQKKREKMNKTESIKDLRRLWNAPSVLKPLYYDGALSFIITDANEVIGYNK